MDGASGGVIEEENNEWGDEELEEQPTTGIPNALLLNGSGGSPGHDDLEKNLDDASNLLETENQAFQQRMWASFQNCARAIAQVYVCNKEQREGGAIVSRDRGGEEQQQRPHECDPHPQGPNEKPPLVFEESFRSAAQHATTLYKDSLETSRRLIDLGIKTGSNRRTKEILAFVKGRKKRFIRRDELINLLIGERSGSSAIKGGGRKHHHLDNSYSFAGIISSSATQACSPLFISQQQGSVAQSSTQGSSQIFGMNPFGSPHLLGGSCSRPHNNHEEDPTNLHLGLQQLFVAGNSSHGHGHPVKRPANSISSANNNPLHLSADEDDDRVLLRNNTSVSNTRVDDELMEDSVESTDNNTNFKRMRFY
ncbi:unnamed protein product [Orchesella dallaii]|uniref:Uncharacterized protein n=1 Tax=Orchesella dallaii TaxID=48710 RepID=A0ABP1R151_9HEXA